MSIVSLHNVHYLYQQCWLHTKLTLQILPNREPGQIPADCHADYVSDHMTRASGAHLLLYGCQPLQRYHISGEVFLCAKFQLFKST